MRPRLEDFTNAYREVHCDELDSRALLRRIQTTINGNPPRGGRQHLRKLLGLGCTVALGATAALASPLSGSISNWLSSSVSNGLSAFASTRESTAASLPSAATPPEVSTTSAFVSRPHSHEPQQPISTPAPVSPPVEPVALPGIESIATRLTPGRRTSPPAVAAAVDESSRTKQPSLYQEAHRLQFVERDYPAAQAAWERYLAVEKAGTLRTDAAYNRALCLVHLGRYEQARAELTKFVAPNAPGAYRSRAATVLQALASAKR